MHQYLIDEETKTSIFLLIAITSVIAAWLLYLLLRSVPFEIPWWIEIPSVFGLFGFFGWLYNNYMWRIWPFNSLQRFYIPNLNGVWAVTIKSSHDKFAESFQASATIRQTASKISISLDTGSSSSFSVTASIIRTDRHDTLELLYNYINRPKPEATETMQIHTGSVWLRIFEDLQRLEGEYFSGRGRQNFGSVEFVKQ